MRRSLLSCPMLLLLATGCHSSRAPDVTATIDLTKPAHAISPYIYGVNQPVDGYNASMVRMGGNRWTAYNWETNASNAGSDWHHQNDEFMVSFPGYANYKTTPGGAAIPTLESGRSHQAATIITVPMAGYVSADMNADGDVNQSGDDYLAKRFKRMLAKKNGPLLLVPDMSDDAVYADEFVSWALTKYPSTPTSPVWFALDNEPELWSETHKRIHPTPPTFEEMSQRTREWAGAIKDVNAEAMVFGFVSYGWNGMSTLQNASDANGRNFTDFFLDEMKAAQTQTGRRLVDVLDLHWYPEAQGGGKRITEKDNSPAMVAARIAAPRSLWDASYVETSWITRDNQKPIALLPLMKGKIDQHYPNTKLSLTEYNYGGGDHISGAIAQADVLGILGRYDLFAAAQWKLHDDESFIGGAFRMYRDYDGKGGRFADKALVVDGVDPATASVYAAIDLSEPARLTIIAINKTSQPQQAELKLEQSVLKSKGLDRRDRAERFELTEASAQPQARESVKVSRDGALRVELKPMSVTLLSVHMRQVRIVSR